MHAQVFINPQSINCFGVEPGKEHVNHNKKIKLTVFHPLRDILVVVFKAVSFKREARPKRSIIIAHGVRKQLPVFVVQVIRIEVFFTHKALLSSTWF